MGKFLQRGRVLIVFLNQTVEHSATNKSSLFVALMFLIPLWFEFTDITVFLHEISACLSMMYYFCSFL